MRGLVALAREAFDDPHAGKGLLQNDRHLSSLFFLRLARRTHFASKNNDWNNAERKKNQRREAELPIDRHQHADLRENSNRILDDIPRNRGESILRHARVAHDARHQLAGFFPVEEIQRLRHQVGKKLGSDVSKDAQTDPRQIVDIQIGKKSPQDHHERDEQAHPNDSPDAWPIV